MNDAARTRVQANGADLDRRIAAAEREKFRWDREYALLVRAIDANARGAVVAGFDCALLQLQREREYAASMSTRAAGIAADLRRERNGI